MRMAPAGLPGEVDINCEGFKHASLEFAPKDGQDVQDDYTLPIEKKQWRKSLDSIMRRCDAHFFDSCCA